MGNQMRYLSKPVTDCHSEKGIGNSFTYYAALMQGWRKQQEDRYICIPDFYKGCGFFGVYDGHGGSEIAEFLRQKLHLEILDALHSQDDMELALYLGFLSCDVSIVESENIAALNDMVEEENKGVGIASQILKHKKSLEAAASSDEDESQLAGPSKKMCTESLSNSVISAETIIQNICQHIAGPSQESKSSEQDSEEVMDIEKPIQYLLNDDIEPSDPEDEDYEFDEEEESSSTESDEETNTISAEEFFKSEVRDYKFKGDSFVPAQQCITAEPHIRCIDIQKEDDFLVIASDGIWNSMNSQDVIDYIHIRLQASDCSLKDICEELFQFILAPDKDNDGSGCDNMCCIIIRFHKDDTCSSRKPSILNKVTSFESSLIKGEENLNMKTNETSHMSADESSTKDTSSSDKETCNQDQNDAHLTAHNSKKPIQYSVDICKNELQLRLPKTEKNISDEFFDYICGDGLSDCWSGINLNNCNVNFLKHYQQNHMLHSSCCLKQKRNLNIRECLKIKQFVTALIRNFVFDHGTCKKQDFKGNHFQLMDCSNDFPIHF
ncbi:probable protein phosphatase 2C 70 [Nephila pilipes]|uniref:protein-serine/threonine phosphatase n=1 Tax=Nephila pilipes TaxID=299642 RepID=A0A8X6QVM3_NEPPI|nr:probable protein phosphatase 2C 70 [Nephila pilipes]